MPDAVPMLKRTGPASPILSDVSAEDGAVPVMLHHALQYDHDIVFTVKGKQQRRPFYLRRGLIMRELILLGGPFVCLMLLWVYIVHHPDELSAFLSWVHDFFGFCYTQSPE